MFVENSVRTTHKEVAVLMVCINEIGGIIETINNLLETPDSEKEMIANGIGTIVCNSFIRSIPDELNIVGLETVVFDKYRLFTNCDIKVKDNINKLLTMLVDHIMNKVYSIVNNDNYVCVTSVIAGVTDSNNDDRVFVITNVDLIKHKFIEIRYYNKEDSYDISANLR